MNWAHYLLQLNFSLIVFYTFYKILLERETWFALNRFYLLAGGLFSLVLPFLHTEWLSAQPVTRRVYAEVENLNALVMEAGIAPERSSGYGSVVAALYLTGVGIAALFFLGRLLQLKRSFNRAAHTGAYAFFNRKVVGAALPDRETIHKHEDIHIRQLHSVDVLFFEIIRILTWFNPISYLLIRAVKATHEFLADEAAAKYRGDKHAYSMLLLSRAFGIQPNELTSPFFTGSMIKKRIYMLSRERSGRTALLKYGLMLPVVVLLLILSSATLRRNTKISEFTETIRLDEAVALAEHTVAGNTYAALPKVSARRYETSVQPAGIMNDADPHTPAGSAARKRGVRTASALSYEMVHEKPIYPGGMEAFYQYLSSNARYPERAAAAGLRGKVRLAFTVRADGKLANIRVLKGLGYGCDDEAVRVLSRSKNWQPGMHAGKPIAVNFNLSVHFGPGESALVSGNEMAGKLAHRAAEPAVADAEPVAGQRRPIVIRGTGSTSTAETAPLYVLDGKPVSDVSANLATLVEPNEIASVSVLKGGLATNSWGTRARNGVIIITTKKEEDRRRLAETNQ